MTYALITGASGGIGLAMAQELAARKHSLLLVARSGEKLESICRELKVRFDVSAHYLACDLSQPNAYRLILEWVAQNSFSVNILINNAGYGIWKKVEDSSIEEIQNMLNLNIVTLVSLCRALVPELKRHSQSYIMNVASTAAYQAVPTLAAYSGSKAFVILFTRSLRIELKNSPISVSCLSPGATSTGFVDRAGMEAIKDRAEKVSMSAESVARIGIRGMFKKKAEILPGFINWFSVKLTYLLPKGIPEKIASGLYLKK